MGRLKLFTKSELSKAMKSLTKFELSAKDTKLVATFNFSSHVDALVFIARITVHAEVADHHPEITFSYRKVKVSLTTHDLKGLTKNDFALAKKIEVIRSRG